jgi:hypothetical protein
LLPVCALPNGRKQDIDANQDQYPWPNGMCGEKNGQPNHPQYSTEWMVRAVKTLSMTKMSWHVEVPDWYANAKVLWVSTRYT